MVKQVNNIYLTKEGTKVEINDKCQPIHNAYTTKIITIKKYINRINCSQLAKMKNSIPDMSLPWNL